MFFTCVVAVLLVSGCMGGDDDKNDRAEHEYIVSGCVALHPEYMLLEFLPAALNVGAAQPRYYIGPARGCSYCGEIRCGVYKKSLSPKHLYTVSACNVARLRSASQVFSVEVSHFFSDTLFVEIAFSRICDISGGIERTDCHMRLPFVKSPTGYYRCIPDGLPVRCHRQPHSGVQRLFVDMNSLFM